MVSPRKGRLVRPRQRVGSARGSPREPPVCQQREYPQQAVWVYSLRPRKTPPTPVPRSHSFFAPRRRRHPPIIYTSRSKIAQLRGATRTKNEYRNSVKIKPKKIIRWQSYSSLAAAKLRVHILTYLHEKSKTRAERSCQVQARRWPMEPASPTVARFFVIHPNIYLYDFTCIVAHFSAGILNMDE